MTVPDDELAKLRTSLMQMMSMLGGAVLEETDDGRLRLLIHSVEVGHWAYEASAPFVFFMRKGYFRTVAKDIQQAEMITRQVINALMEDEHNS